MDEYTKRVQPIKALAIGGLSLLAIPFLLIALGFFALIIYAFI